ncbi:MAG: hypothetical protein MUO59_06415, partial [Actinobacteria bacterium]|nr:hypothetical protein [Actinomycetota bacterium]
MKKSVTTSLFIKFLIFIIVFSLFFSASTLYAGDRVLSNGLDGSGINNTITINSGSTLYDDEIDIEAQAALLMDFKTGNVLWEKNSKVPVYPASITKIMTGILAIENIADP